MTLHTKPLSGKLPEIADAALIFSEENRRYFTEFPSSDGVLLVTAGDALFFTDSRYIEAAEDSIGKELVRDSAGLYETLREIFARRGIKTVAIENDRLTVAQLGSLREKLPDTDLRTDGALAQAIEELRKAKNPKETEKIKAAQAIAETAFTHILDFIKPGKTEKEIALELDFYMLSHGAEAISFETIAVGGKNSSMPHGVPGSYEVKNGDFITMDFGAVIDGYHSDMTRTVMLGVPTAKQISVYDTVLKAQNTALGVLCDGCLCSDADKAARDVIDAAGYGKNFGHSTGHGVGIEIHEAPNVSPNSKAVLGEGNIVTVEPGIYIPGEFGVRIEDMAYITHSGCVNLTNAPKNLISL